jgi:hypothetical protein
VLPTDKIQANLSSDIPLNVSGDTQISLNFNTDIGQPTDTARAHILIAGTYTEIMCRCRRVMWMTRERTSVSAFDTLPRVRSLDDILSGKVQAVTIRTRSSIDVALELKTERVSQQSEWKRTVGEDGKWTFPLDIFVDTLARLEDAYATVDVLIADRRITVMRIAAQLEISQISTETNLDKETGAMILTVRWHQQQNFRNRIIRLWPDLRPWEGPITLKIPDDAPSEATYVLDPTTKPGRFILEFDVVQTDWAPRSTRPTRAARNVKDVFIGIPDDFQEVFIQGVIAEREAEGRTWLEDLVFEAILLKDPVDREVSFPIDAELLPFLLIALLYEARETLTYSYDEKRLRRMIYLASYDQVGLARWASQHLTNWVSQHRLEGSALELVLALLGDVHAVEATSLTPAEWDRLWRASPLLGAKFAGVNNQDEHAGLWFDHTGWPEPEDDLADPDEVQETDRLDQRLPAIGDPIFPEVRSKSKYELSEIRLQFQSPTESTQDTTDEGQGDNTTFRVNRSNRIGPLSPGGQFDAMFDFLIFHADDPSPIDDWMNELPEIVYTKDDTADQLYPRYQLSPWCSVPRHIHRLAQLIVRDGANDPEILGALLRARPFASSLIHRSLLYEIAELRRHHESRP